MSMTSHIKDGDRAVVVIADRLGDTATVSGKAVEAGKALYVGPFLLRHSNGVDADQLLRVIAPLPPLEYKAGDVWRMDGSLFGLAVVAEDGGRPTDIHTGDQLTDYELRREWTRIYREG